MTFLEQAVNAQRENRFTDWYSSLSKEEQEQFNAEFQDALTNLMSLVETVSEFMRNILPQIIESLTQSFYQFGKSIEAIKK